MNGRSDIAKACTVNPLKLSPALGAALAFMGVDRSMPLLHGGQGCTAFALVMSVRHFREAIPMQTTAMNELSSILGGADNVEQAIANLYQRARPRLIGLCTTALTETRDEDMQGDLRLILGRHPEWHDLDVVLAATPDYAGSLEDGWARAVEAIVGDLVAPTSGRRTLRQVTVLAGSHLTPGDVAAVREIVETFQLNAIVLPDLGASLDGHVPDAYVPTTLGGTTVEEIRGIGESVLTLAIGEHMRKAARLIAERTGVPYEVFPSLTGLEAVDAFVAALMAASRADVPPRLVRERSQLVDAMLDGHFYFGERRVAVAGEPETVAAMARFCADMGCRVVAAVAATRKPILDRIEVDQVMVGDLDDLETHLIGTGCDLVVGSSYAGRMAVRAGAPLWRAGFPVFDRLGAAQRVTVGYRGTRDLIFDIGNIFLEQERAHGLAPARDDKATGHAGEYGTEAACH